MRAPSQSNNPLFNKDVSLELDLLKGIDITKATTWSQIEMQCAVRGIDVTFDLFKLFLMSSGVLLNMHKIMLKCIAKTDFLTKYAGHEDTAEIIYSMSDPYFVASKAGSTIIGFAQANSDGSDGVQMMFGDWNYDTDMFDISASKKRMYKMMSVFDRRFPLMFIKFFNKHKRELLAYDNEFVNWLFTRTRVRADSNELFKKLYVEMEKEKDAIDKTRMFLS